MLQERVPMTTGDAPPHLGTRRASLASGDASASGAAGAVAVLALVVAAAFGLAEGAGLPGWASALIIAGVVVALAMALALIGHSQLATPVSTTATQRQVSQDVAWLTQRLTESA
jgi:fatty acid desaturase